MAKPIRACRVDHTPHEADTRYLGAAMRPYQSFEGLDMDMVLNMVMDHHRHEQCLVFLTDSPTCYAVRGEW